MWHTTESIATSRFFDAKKLTAFAVENENKYGVVQEEDRVEVNTWYANDLCKDFLAQGGVRTLPKG
jgi:hypothetical protein